MIRLAALISSLPSLISTFSLSDFSAFSLTGSFSPSAFSFSGSFESSDSTFSSSLTNFSFSILSFSGGFSKSARTFSNAFSLSALTFSAGFSLSDLTLTTGGPAAACSSISASARLVVHDARLSHGWWMHAATGIRKGSAVRPRGPTRR